MFIMKIVGIVLLLAAAVCAKHEEYNGWTSYAVNPSTFEQLKVIGQLVDQYEVDVFSYPTVQREGLVLVRPEVNDSVVKALEENQISYSVHVSDIKAVLDQEDAVNARRKVEARGRSGGRSLPYDAYQEFPVIDDYLQDIARRYPNLVKLVTPANSFEGRPIRYLKISTTNFEDTRKPVIFLEGGIHAREWISPPTVTWAIHKLVENNTEPDLLRDFDWILLPVSNPDGYQFTHTNSRFWRKTRSTVGQNTARCPGVDGNRNYDFQWNTVGTSSNPCSDTYAGTAPFSEIETRVVRDIIHEYLPRMKLFLTMHSYGSMILYPWGHDGSLSSNAFALHTVGVAMAEDIDKVSLPNFPSYTVGNSVLVIGYAAAGAAEDYAHLAGVPLSYTYELPGLRSGLNGFNLDPIYIQQVAIETWAGIVAGARRIAQM
ncbi:hypothetical protein JYU34_010212 [Plutella xylostella]|uniref:Peptidase M14 domain-containing protein n=1 Tax=Plutella xylostella TaxID=51655 RepID=A0ABQ7QIT6_PLUXY|nr:hypothetical protein JYU34_010212 [Plutella xylostella]